MYQQLTMSLTEFFNNRLIDRTELAIDSFFVSWFEQHPFVSWIVGHPIISLVLTLVILVLLIRLLIAVYKLITDSLDRFWLWILRSPWLLIKLIFGWEVNTSIGYAEVSPIRGQASAPLSVKPKSPTATNITNYQVTTDSELLTEICDRLNTIERQQQQILQEITSLKEQTKTVNHRAIELVLPESKK
jgi:hypothetical protein